MWERGVPRMYAWQPQDSIDVATNMESYRWQTLSHFENGHDITAYCCVQQEMLSLSSVCSKILVRLQNDVVETLVPILEMGSLVGPSAIGMCSGGETLRNCQQGYYWTILTC